MPRTRITPGTVGPVAVVPLGYDVSKDEQVEVVIPRPSTDGGETLDYPRGIKVAQSVKVETPDGIREFMLNRWRGLARVVDVDGTTAVMVRRWRPTRAAAEAATRQAGLDKLAEWERRRQAHRDAAATSAEGDTTTTVSDLVDQVLAHLAALGRLKPKTMQDYRYAAEHVREHVIGALLPRQVDVTAVRTFLADCAASHGRGGAKHARAVLSKALDRAVETAACKTPLNVSLVVRNAIPDVMVRDPGLRDTRKAPTDREVAALLWRLSHDPEAGAMVGGRRKSSHGQAGTAPVNGKDIADTVAALFGLGLRVGEASAVRWCDLDLDRGVAHVSGTVTSLAGVGTVRQASTKTQGSTRDVLIVGWLAARLRRRAALFGIDLTNPPATPVFGSPQFPERYRDQRNLSRAIALLFDRYGLDYARAHAGRKWRVTSLVERGVPIHKVSALVGHTKEATTHLYLAKGRGTDDDVRAAL